MSYLVDTDVVADYLNGHDVAIELLNSIHADGSAISVITFGEIYEGIYFGRDPGAAEQGFQRFLRMFTVLPVDTAIMQRFALIRGNLRQSGQLIGDPDIVIAATAMHFGLQLVTRNHRHFSRIPDLSIVTPQRQ